jgi:hypothetical protein
VHKKLIAFMDNVEQYFGQIEKYMENNISVRENQDILSRLHSQSELLNMMIQKFVTKQGESLDLTN